MGDVKRETNKFKVANFKQIDWSAVEEKLMKGPSTVKVMDSTGQFVSVLGSKETNRTIRARNTSQESSQ